MQLSELALAVSIFGAIFAFVGSFAVVRFMTNKHEVELEKKVSKSQCVATTEGIRRELSLIHTRLGELDKSTDNNFKTVIELIKNGSR